MTRICWSSSASCSFYGFMIQLSVKKRLFCKILLAIWETFLNENLCNYHSYLISCKFVFISLLLFLKNQKKKLIILASGWSGTEKSSCLLFCRESYFTSKPCRINSLLSRTILISYSCLHYSSVLSQIE